METKVDFSITESNVLGIKTCRCNSDFFDAAELYNQITRNEYDLCRLKVAAEDEMASKRLHTMGLPFYFSGSIRRYKTKVSEKPAGNYNFPDLAFEMYDGTQDKLLKDMLVGTWGTYPLGYYRTPFVGDMVTKEQEIESVFQFYKKFNFKKDYPANTIMFIRHGDNYVGFFALNIVDNNLESHIGGILGPYRKSGYFLDKLRYIKEFCVNNNLENFIFGARNENAEVQRIFQFAGFQPRGSENVFHIPSLLTYSRKKAIVSEISISKGNTKDIYQQLQNICFGHVPDFADGFNKASFHLNHASLIAQQTSVKVTLSFPVITTDETLIVMKFDPVNNTYPTGYFMLNR